jgi:hypothetical protein
MKFCCQEDDMSNQQRGRASRLARESAKRTLRRYGEATAGLRRGPDFVIIGAKRGGSTSMYKYVLEHPLIQPLFPRRQHIKGPHYYDTGYAHGLTWYRSHFPVEVAGRQAIRPFSPLSICGEASPYYMFHPLAPERLARDFPGVRIIAVLRDPVERAYSHFKERTHHGGETLSFEDALAAESDRLRGEAERIVADPAYVSAEHEHHSYLAQGRYLDMLPRWFRLFPSDQFHIALSEEFYADPDREVNAVWNFLGLPPHELRSRFKHNYMPSADMLPETRVRLQESLADHHRGLADLLGRPLPWPVKAEPVP